MDLSLTSPIQYVPRVGPAMALKCKRLGIHTVYDILYYPPFRYNDFSLVSVIASIQVGESVTIHGVIESHKTFVTKTGKRMQEAIAADETGKISIIWFNQPYLTSVLPPGTHVNIAGQVQWFGRKIALISPDYEIVNPEDENDSLHTGRLVPIYPETAGVTSKWLRGRIAYVLERILPGVEDPFTQSIRQSYELMETKEALSGIHFPKTQQEAIHAKRTLAFHELLLFQLRAMKERRIWETTQQAYEIKGNISSIDTFITSLPFTLTHDQKKATDEILSDMKRAFPMNRLLEGDVGSGKTVVAAIAVTAVQTCGKRAVLMAPTQILAEQHYESIRALFSAHDIPVAIRTAHTKEGPEDATLLIGTHALLAEAVSFQDVALVIIDEQQRFGVSQRKLLRDKTSTAKTPHLLTMTATPIPRTIAQALYGNVDLSVISEMPTGRTIIKTWVVPKEKRDKAYEWIRKTLQTTHAQAFIVCPLIEQSETLASVKSVKDEFTHLSSDIFPELRLGLVHGRLKPNEKTRVLDAFRKSELDILVATPVVEVGIDIPNATIMLIEGADRFGLAQLHQLRGRVGRRSNQSYCLLFSASDEDKAIQRLKTMETIHSGPLLAEADLAIRGPGELFGTRQHGIPNLIFGSIFDTDLMKQTKTLAGEITTLDPELSTFPLLSMKLAEDTIGDSSLE
jgi:ATP-dependent DNA helicase RecG